MSPPVSPPGAGGLGNAHFETTAPDPAPGERPVLYVDAPPKPAKTPRKRAAACSSASRRTGLRLICPRTVKR